MAARSARALIRGAALVLLLHWCVGAWAADDLAPPQRLVQETADSLRGLVQAQRSVLAADPGRLQDLVREHLMPHVDLARLSALAIGRAWRTATAEQRARFVAEFERLLIRTYATGLLTAEDWKIRHPPQRIPPEADDLVVRTEVLRSGSRPVPVDYRMHRAGGRWRVYDVVIEGVSFASTYRTSFEQEVRQGGLDGLIDRLGALNGRGVGATLPAG
jgi:phospholipid transport system substrate-binding protein